MISDNTLIPHLLASASNPTHTQAVNLLSEAANSTMLTKYLARILKNENELNDIAGRSYRHRNDFDKIVLAQSRGGSKVRLHLWYPQMDELNNAVDIHDHFWDFSSVVLWGSLVSRVFVPSEEQGYIAAKRFQLIPEFNGDHLLTPICESKLMCIDYKLLNRGNTHMLRHGQLHSVHCHEKQMAITLLLQGPRICQENNVYCVREIVEHQSKIEVTHMPVAYLKEKLRLVCDQLVTSEA